MEKVPSGFGAPKNPNVSTHGVLYSRWQPNPERTVLSLRGSGLSVAPTGPPITRVL